MVSRKAIGCIDCSGDREEGRRRCVKCHTERRRRIHRANGNHRKRCRHYGVPFDSTVTRLKVCQRDKWICQICGVKTRMVACLKKPHDDEATLDHIVPLQRKTKGHTWDNVQCACRRCNCYIKRDRSVVCQMRLPVA
jgi:5-methylcytosine-specific restriction endonuclease McrA